MPDNLTVTIGADSSRLLADLKLAQAALKSLNAEMTALARTAQQTGDRTAVDAMAPKIVAARNEVVRLNAAWKEVAPSVNTATRSVGIFTDVSNRELIKLSRNFGNLNKTAETFGVILGGAFGGFTGGLFARAISSAFGALITQLDEASKRLTALQQAAREAGVKPIAVQAAGEAAQQAGLQAEAGEKAFTSFSKAVQEARAAVPREETRGVLALRGAGPDPSVTGAAVNDPAKAISAVGAAAKDAAGDVRVLRGNLADTTAQFDALGRLLPRVGRGGAPSPIDFADPAKLLGLDRIKVGEEVKGYENAIKRLLELAKQFPSQTNVIAQKVFEMPLANIQDIAGNAEKLDALIKKLAATARGATDEHLKDNKELVKSQSEVDNAWKETGSAIANGLLATRIAFNQFQTEVIKGLPQALRDMFDFRVLHEAERLFGVVGSAFSAMTQSMTDAWSAMWASIGDATNTAVAWISKQIQSIKDAAASAASTLSSSFPGDPSIPAMPMASGGMVRGRGTATSDSILARLSNGEFVLNAGSVRRLGVGFLDGLNSFASGGLVTPLPRFAEGGLVGGGGTPVHLHLGGHSFALSGSESVVGSLVVEAHRHKIRSAGVKPSWYGGTPGR